MATTEAAEQLIATARKEAAKMQHIATTMAAGSEIRMSPESFGEIAKTLAALTDMAATVDAPRETAPGSAEFQDGSWIPLGYHERVRAALVETRSALAESITENDRLRSSSRMSGSLGGLIEFGPRGALRSA